PPSNVSPKFGFTDGNQHTNQGTISLGTTGTGFGSNDLHVTLTNGSNVFLEGDQTNVLQTTGSKFTLDFGVNVKFTTATTIELGAIRVQANEYGIVLLNSTSCPGHGYCVDQTSPAINPDYQDVSSITFNVWHHVTVTLIRETNNWGASVFFDGTKLDDVATGAFRGA